MRNFIIYTIIIASLLIGSTAEAQQPKLEEIINSHLKMTGLDSLPQKMKTFFFEGGMVQDNKVFPVKIYGIWPDKYRIDLTFNNEIYTKISNGYSIWEFTSKMDSISTSSAQKFECHNFIERVTGSLFNYANGTVKANLLSVVSIDDVELYKIEVLIGKYVRIYYIDRLSYHIIRIDDDNKENKVTYYSDFKKVDRYYLPYGITGFEGGKPAISMVFKSIIINGKVLPDLFEKPVFKSKK